MHGNGVHKRLTNTYYNDPDRASECGYLFAAAARAKNHEHAAAATSNVSIARVRSSAKEGRSLQTS